jgi:hypothetical protein
MSAQYLKEESIMVNKIQVTAISHGTLKLKEDEIEKYLKTEGNSFSRSGEWMCLEDEVGEKTKILISGLVESKKFPDDVNIVDELMGISSHVKAISTSLFSGNPTYNVFISQKQEKCINIFNQLNIDKKINTFAFNYNENVYIELKIDPYRCQMIMIGISDTKDIINIYYNLINDNKNLFNNNEESIKKKFINLQQYKNELISEESLMQCDYAMQHKVNSF